mmetsp:Transcript_99831/g.174159  ORF Transcript_99831/g.174159 Transcript_99831/m.174159 type:complete len:444 (+) Transcript_99831:476-1807(+)
MIPGTRKMMPGTRKMMLGTRKMTPGTKKMMLGTRKRIVGIKRTMPGARPIVGIKRMSGQAAPLILGAPRKKKPAGRNQAGTKRKRAGTKRRTAGTKRTTAGAKATTSGQQLMTSGESRTTSGESRMTNGRKRTTAGEPRRMTSGSPVGKTLGEVARMPGEPRRKKLAGIRRVAGTQNQTPATLGTERRLLRVGSRRVGTKRTIGRTRGTASKTAGRPGTEEEEIAEVRSGLGKTPNLNRVRSHLGPDRPHVDLPLVLPFQAGVTIILVALDQAAAARGRRHGSQHLQRRGRHLAVVPPVVVRPSVEEVETLMLALLDRRGGQRRRRRLARLHGREEKSRAHTRRIRSRRWMRTQKTRSRLRRWRTQKRFWPASTFRPPSRSGISYNTLFGRATRLCRRAGFERGPGATGLSITSASQTTTPLSTLTMWYEHAGCRHQNESGTR